MRNLLTHTFLLVQVKLKLTEHLHPKKTTLCVTPAEARTSDDPDLVARYRSVKAMRAALRGIPIVSTSWIAQCVEVGYFQTPDPSSLVRSLPTSVTNIDGAPQSNFGVAHLAACLKRLPSFQFLNGRMVFICGSLNRETSADVSLLLRETGATLIAHASAVIARIRAADETSKVILLGCNQAGSISNALESEIRSHPSHVLLVNLQWLFDSISCGYALDGQAYKPQGKQALELCELTLN